MIPRMTPFRIVLATSICALMASGCKVGPNYSRPALNLPGQYRGIAPDQSNQPPGQPIAEMNWENVFQDETLRAFIKEALANNYDIRIAATRILEAKTNSGITRANQLPSRQWPGRGRLPAQFACSEWPDRGLGGNRN